MYYLSGTQYDHADLGCGPKHSLRYLLSTLPWQPVYSKAGRQTRESCWITNVGCSCRYFYGHKDWIPSDMTSWLISLTQHIAAIVNVNPATMNSLNCNRYSDSLESLGLHADDEDIFKSTTGEAVIISLTIGAERDFKVVCNTSKKYVVVPLGDHDIAIMTGQMQNFYKHQVIRGSKGVRYNLTWRMLTGCQCQKR